MSKDITSYYGTILLDEFPYIGQYSSTKIRPMLVVSNDAFYNLRAIKKVMVAHITSTIGRNLIDFDFIIEQGTEDYNNSGLRSISRVCLDKLLPFEIRNQTRILGRMSPEFMKRVKVVCQSIF